MLLNTHNGIGGAKALIIIDLHIHDQLRLV